MPARSVTVGSAATRRSVTSTATCAAAWFVKVVIVVIAVILASLAIADVESQAEDPVHDRKNSGKEGANVGEVVVPCEVADQECKSVLELQKVRIPGPMAAATK
jgi:hypothetical protein